MGGTGVSQFVDVQSSTHRQVNWLVFCYHSKVNPRFLGSWLFKKTVATIKMPEIGRAIKTKQPRS